MNALLREELSEVQEMQFGIYHGEEEEEKVKERFKIKDLGGANWAFRKLKAIDEKEKEIDELVEREIQRIKDWAKEDKNKLSDSRNFFSFLLEEYYREQREEDPKFKLSTPYGKVTSRKHQPKWTYDDETIIESLKSAKLDEFIRVKEEVNKVDFKKKVGVLKNIVSLNGVICNDVEKYNDVLFINKETGEIYDTGEHEYHVSAVVYGDKIISGVRVEDREDSITIKVVE